jgi:hypothetical protein
MVIWCVGERTHKAREPWIKLSAKEKAVYKLKAADNKLEAQALFDRDAPSREEVCVCDASC